MGFIGSHIVDRCVAQGNDVIVLDNLSTSTLINLKKYLKEKVIEFVRGDIRDLETVRKCMKNVDAVFHEAAQVSVPLSIKDPTYTTEVNIGGVLNLLIAGFEQKIERFVYASSSSVYGNPSNLPIPENATLRPLSPYAASKIASEAYCTAFYEMKKVPVTCLRYFNVFGPRRPGNRSPDVITDFIQNLRKKKPLKIFGNGNQTRDFIHVRSVVEANMLALTRDKAVGETFNVGSGRATRIIELVNILEKCKGEEIPTIHLPPREGDVEHSQADITKASIMLDYKPTTNLEDDVKKLFKSYIEHHEN